MALTSRPFKMAKWLSAMSFRPLMQSGIESLETLFRDSKENSIALNKLEIELTHRTTNRAKALLKKVHQAKLALLSKHSVNEHTLISPITDLFGDDIAKADQIFVEVIEVNTPLVDNPTDQPVIDLKDESISISQAYRILNSSKASPWDAIEKARREIVEKANPLNWRILSNQEQEKFTKEAKLANTAYLILLKQRDSGLD